MSRGGEGAVGRWSTGHGKLTMGLRKRIGEWVHLKGQSRTLLLLLLSFRWHRLRWGGGKERRLLSFFRIVLFFWRGGVVGGVE